MSHLNSLFIIIVKVINVNDVVCVINVLLLLLVVVSVIIVIVVVVVVWVLLLLLLRFFFHWELGSKIHHVWDISTPCITLRWYVIRKKRNIRTDIRTGSFLDIFI